MEENERRLYPMRFLENSFTMPWGSVTYKIADLGVVDSMVAEGWFGGNTLSELMGTYMERVVGDDAFEYYGLQFPLLVKEIRTTGWQPLQVNVADGPAEERYDSFGKTALWIVLEAVPGSGMFLGLKRDVEPEDFYRRCLEGRVGEVLNEIRPSAGDAFVIERGTVYSAGPGLTILEISECSELTLILNDLGSNLPEDSPVLLEEAFDLIDFSEYTSPAVLTPRETSAPQTPPPASPAVPPLTWPRVATVSEGLTPPGEDSRGIKALADRNEFIVRRMALRDPLHVFSEQPGGFTIYHCVRGEAAIQPVPGADSFTQVTVKAGQSALVPSEVNDILLLPFREGTVLLEATVPRRELLDSYSSPSSPEAGSAPDPHVRNWNQ